LWSKARDRRTHGSPAPARGACRRPARVRDARGQRRVCHHRRPHPRAAQELIEIGPAAPNRMGPMDPIMLRNRLLVATAMWREATGEPLPKMAPGDPVDQIQAFELQLVERLCSEATPENAREVADRTWDLVHDRGDDDPVKRRVVECHEALARM